MRLNFFARLAIATTLAIIAAAIERDRLFGDQASAGTWIGASGFIIALILLTLRQNEVGVALARSKSLQAGEPASQERERLEFALATTRTGLWEWNVGSSNVFLSAECREILGAESASEETLGTMSRFLHPEDSLQIMEAIQTALEQEGAFQLECRVVPGNGSVRWVLNRGEMQYRDGRRFRLRGTIQDVTDRKRMEGLFADSEKRQRTIIEALPECVKTIAADGKLLTMNPAGLAMLEVQNLAEAQQRPLLEFVCPEHREEFCALHSKVMSGQSGALRFEVMGLHGTRRWLETFAVPLRNDAGEVSELLGITRDITAQQRHEAELQASEDRFRKVFDYSPIPMGISDTQDRLLKVNQAFCDLTGYNEKELAVMGFRGITHPDDLDKNANEQSSLLRENETSLQFQKRYVHKQGHTIWVLLYKSLVRDHDGKPQYFIGQAKDITERKLTEAKLAEESHRREEVLALLDTLQTEAPVGIAFVDRDNRFVRCNEALAEISGAAAAEHLGRKVEEIVPQLWPQFEPIYQRIRSGGDAVVNQEISGETVSRPGVTRYWMCYFYPVKLGEEVLGIGLIVNEVTQIKQATAALQVSEKRLMAIVRALPDLILRVSGDGRILDYHSLQPDALFSTSSNLRGSYLRGLLPEQSAQLLEDRLKLALSSQQLQVVEFDFQSAASERLYVEARMIVGRPDEAILILRNVTEKRQMETRLRQKQTLDAIAQLAGGIAHDFNNLLTVIQGNNHILTASLEQCDPRLSMTGAIQAAGSQAAKLTRQLLSFSRGIRLEPAILNVNDVIEQSSELWRTIVGQRIELVTDLVSGLWAVEVDRNQIEQLLLNLVVNARDAMPNGGRLRVETKNLGEGVIPPEDWAAVSSVTDGEPRFIEITVTDSGVGMSDDVLSRIYEPFFTTKDVGQGSGLGLSTCHGIVRQSGGWIDVSSQLGNGSTFRVVLPCQPNLTIGCRADVAEAELATSSLQ